MNVDLFDETANAFAENIDRQLAEGRYRRGTVFLEAIDRVLTGARLLDYGCGPGRLSALLASHGHKVLGVDPSEGMLLCARQMERERDNVRFQNLNDFHPAPASFDGIVCSSVIEYVSDPAELLAQFFAWLRPSGYLFITYANRRSLWRRYAELIERNRAPHMRQQHNIWSDREVRRRLQSVGFAPLGRTVFFESPADRNAPWLSGFSAVGTLGLVVARAGN